MSGRDTQPKLLLSHYLSVFSSRQHSDQNSWVVHLLFKPQLLFRVGHWHLMWMASQIFLLMSMVSCSTLLISSQSILSTHNFIFSSGRVHTSTCTITSLSLPSILPGTLSLGLPASGLINSPDAEGKLRPSFCWCGRLWERLRPFTPPKLWATLLNTTPSSVLPVVAWWRLWDNINRVWKEGCPDPVFLLHFHENLVCICCTFLLLS